MTDYGVQPTGYVRKPLDVALAELEAAMVTEFGPGVIQTSVSPFGQLNGLMADLLTTLDEGNLDLYQSYDPDEAEGTRLDILARLRVTARGGRSDEELRRAITNVGQSRIDIQDIEHALRGLTGVTYAKLFDQAEELERGTVAVAVIGGDDSEIADTIRRYIVPGISTFGNQRVSSLIDGKCRDFSIVRPIEVPVKVTLSLRARSGSSTCPPPADSAIATSFAQEWLATRENGLPVSHYTLRSLIEKLYPSIELVSFVGQRDAIVSGVNVPILIGFLEIASIPAANVEIVWL